MKTKELSIALKEIAGKVGFSRCGVAQVHQVDTTIFEEWLREGNQAQMEYLSNHLDIRREPKLLLENAQSVIMCAANYYPSQTQPSDVPQVAYYAYGKDYHKWFKKRLKLMEQFIINQTPNAHTRSFVDTAPIFERYWATQSGIGFIGKSNNLIIPDAGSYFLLGGILVDIELEYDQPLNINCGTCNACIEACPTHALQAPYRLDARLCLSYRTIEHKGDYTSLPDVSHKDRLYGCDACQQSCPFNRFATPTEIPECIPLPFLSRLQSISDSPPLTDDDFHDIFQSSPIKRIKKEGLQRNIKAILKQT